MFKLAIRLVAACQSQEIVHGNLGSREEKFAEKPTKMIASTNYSAMSNSRKRARDGQLRTKSKSTVENHKRRKLRTVPSSIPKLTDICAKHVAENFPFQHVEESLPQIPEPIQERIIFWAFPKDEQDIALYSSTNSHNMSGEQQKQPFQLGVKLYESGNVSEVLQVGFHLSGTVKETQGICLQRKVLTCKVSLKFDRCRITTVTCSCNNRSILWCAHAVALAVYRIRRAAHVKIKVPISESILQLKTPQLQTLLLHLITQHHQDILPSVQNLLDDLKQPDSEINKAVGIPDPTAGACSESESLWYLNSDLIREEVKTGLEPNNTGKNISSLISKVREMFLCGDNNAVLLLTLITESFMESMKNPLELRSRVSDKARKLLDSMSLVWLCAALNPRITPDEKDELKQKLTSWDQEQKSHQHPDEVGPDPSSMFATFEVPLSALDWTYPPQEDDIIRAAAYADAFCCHGNHEEAVKIAVKMAEKLQLSSLDKIHEKEPSCSLTESSWLGHSVDPINVLFDVLCVEVEKNKGLANIYMPLAVRIAFVGLSQVKVFPSDKYKQLRMCHREEQLIAQLEELDFTSEYLRPVICRFCEYLRDRESRNLRDRQSNRVSLSHSFTRFLFNKVSSFDKDLAYSFSIPLLGLPPSLRQDEASGDDLDIGSNSVCYILSHLQSQQSELASNLLRGCSDDTEYLASVVKSIKNNIRNHSQLFRLAKQANAILEDNLEALKLNQTDTEQDAKSELQKAALELGVKAVQLTLTEHSWDRREMVRWLVSTSVIRGKQSVFMLFRRWRALFTPEEVSKDVATMLTSQPVLFTLQMDKKEEDNFMSHLRSIVIESAIHDPPSCALFALTLCECEPVAFDLACQIVLESANRLSTSQLFSIARYLERKRYLQKALKIATLAMKKLDLEQETHPAVCEVFWACALACSLGKDELTQITPIICNCVRNPVILTEIARRSVRTSNYAMQGGQNKGKAMKLSFDKEPISRLMAASQQLFIQEVQKKLDNISPKQYANFVLYLGKVKNGFDLVDEGPEQFQWLLDFIATSQKGRKKLQKLIRDSFFVSRTVSEFGYQS